MPTPPRKLHRVNGYDAMMAVLRASGEVRGGRWIQGAPTHVLAELLTALEQRGYYLGTADLEDAP